MIRRTFLGFSLLAFLSACDSDPAPSPPTDAGSEAAVMSDAGADSGTATDAGADTGAATDTGSTTDSGTPTDTGSATDSGADAGTATDVGTPTDTGSATDSGAPTDAGGCNAVTLSAGNVPETAGAGAFPTPAGGTIADGTYQLTGFYIYPPGSIDAYRRRETLVISGGSVQSARQTDSGAIERNTGTFTTSGTNLVFSVTCPGAATVTVPYTASATTLRIFDISPGVNEVHEYTRQ